MSIDTLSLPAPEGMTTAQSTLAARYRFGAGCLADAETGACCCYSAHAEPWVDLVAPLLLADKNFGDAANLRAWLAGRSTGHSSRWYTQQRYGGR